MGRCRSNPGGTWIVVVSIFGLKPGSALSGLCEIGASYDAGRTGFSPAVAYGAPLS